jgi:hypothetical protein
MVSFPVYIYILDDSVVCIVAWSMVDMRVRILGPFIAKILTGLSACETLLGHDMSVKGKTFKVPLTAPD